MIEKPLKDESESSDDNGFRDLVQPIRTAIYTMTFIAAMYSLVKIGELSS